MSAVAAVLRATGDDREPAYGAADAAGDRRVLLGQPLVQGLALVLIELVEAAVRSGAPEIAADAMARLEERALASGAATIALGVFPGPLLELAEQSSIFITR